MCDRAAQSGVTIAIQNHHDLGLNTDALLELLADIDRPNCKLGFDAWSPALRGENLYAAARKAAPYTAITTNADYIRVPRHRYRPELVNYETVSPDWVRAVPFGTGCIDYAAFFKGLRDGDRGRDGVVSATPPSEPNGRISRIRLSSQWFLCETNHKHTSRVPD